VWHCWGQERCVQSVLVGRPEGSSHSEDLGVDVRVVIKSVFKNWGWRGLDWVDVAQDRDSWQGFCER